MLSTIHTCKGSLVSGVQHFLNDIIMIFHKKMAIVCVFWGIFSALSRFTQKIHIFDANFQNMFQLSSVFFLFTPDAS